MSMTTQMRRLVAAIAAVGLFTTTATGLASGSHHKGGDDSDKMKKEMNEHDMERDMDRDKENHHDRRKDKMRDHHEEEENHHSDEDEENHD